MSSSLVFDPNVNKVIHSFGGYEPNGKGLFQYPRVESTLYGNQQKQSLDLDIKPTGNVWEVFQNPILDTVASHYRIFIQDPRLALPDYREKDQSHLLRASSAKTDRTDGHFKSKDHFKSQAETPEVLPCCTKRLAGKVGPQETPLLRKPIDPIHWKPDLFDTKYEKYYLRNLLIEDPYREFLTSCSEATAPAHYCSEYRQSYSGNPVLETSSSARIIGLSRPTDIPEPCQWKRYKTQKLRDVIFTHEKDPIDSHLDYNDPKRYNLWPRLKMSYDQMLEGNYRPRPRSGVEYSTTTLLPALTPYPKQWII